MVPATRSSTGSAAPSIVDQFATAFIPGKVSGQRDDRDIDPAKLVTERRYITERRYVAR